ncbi:uncharacterized protein LOC134250803 [Saccostrea cucullata]|uniref:uncharacterized protein LOC134250803 n=1 Tax=Saccostrea cuccullata TaxID=36930 RepID=UPI002ED22403
MPTKYEVPSRADIGCDMEKAINPPKREWDHEPDKTDQELGADIERVHLSWNRYFDGETEFDDLNDLYQRMLCRFGKLKKKELSHFHLPEEKISPSVYLTRQEK